MDITNSDRGVNSPMELEGKNCWKTVSAERVAYLIDAEPYFRSFKEAALRARKSIIIIGWEVNSRLLLEFPEQARDDVPNELGPFLNSLVTRRDSLQVHVLTWNAPLPYSLEREWLQRARFDWFSHPRLNFALDAEHPIGASHHQKIVVIDDEVAFVGGIDLGPERLDDREHRPDDRRRLNPDGSSYGPRHDVQLAVSGPVAHALGDLARQRWRDATGQQLKPAEVDGDCWPETVSPDLENVEVAIARTCPEWKGRSAIREIEALYLDTVNSAQGSLYIENQYFTATRVAQALLDRLPRADCPEIVLVVPEAPTTWLERTSMGVRQGYVLSRLRQADQHGRLRVYMPVVGKAGDVSVNVHSKVMVADGRFLRVGSSNLNNRSMGLDSECDLAIAATPGSRTAESIAAFRNSLLAEHLNVSLDDLVAKHEECDSLIETIEHFRGDGRSLKPFPEIEPGEIDEMISSSELLDPQSPVESERLADELANHEDSQMNLRDAFKRLGSVIVVLFLLAAAWRWGPLAQLVDFETLKAWSDMLQGDWLGVGAGLGIFLVAGLFMFPVTVLIAAAGLAFGPFLGFTVALCGSLLSAVCGYGLGVVLGRAAVRRVLGGKLDRISRQLARRGILSMTIIRLLPLAPFTLVNFAAGASHVRFRDFVVGTILGMAPGITAIALFSGQLGKVVHAPDQLNIGLLIGLSLAMVLAAAWSYRRFVYRPAQREDA